MPLPVAAWMPLPSQTAWWNACKTASRFGLGVAVIVVVAACQPTVKVEAPDKPIEINLNVKIEQEVRVKIEREVDDLFEQNPDIF